MTEKILAGLVLAVCALLMLRLLLGAARRQRFDAWFSRAWYRLRHQATKLWHWRRSRQRARRLADEAIRRAAAGEWDGNVYKPKTFKRPPRDKMH